MGTVKSKEEILECARKAIETASRGDLDAWFEINRWVYSRLQLDERRKKPKKIDLFRRQNGVCHICGEKIGDIKSTDIHRLDDRRWYDEDNVVLVHRECHQKSKSRKA